MRSLFRAMILLCVISRLSQGAQDVGSDEWDMARNKRVRVLAPELAAKPIAGVLAAADSQTLAVVVAKHGTTVVFPVHLVSEVKAYGGRDRARGARRGALIGVAAGGLTFLSTQKEVRENDAFGIATIALALSTFVGFPAIGSLVGAIMAPERWETMQFIPGARQSSAVVLRFQPSDVLRVTTANGRYRGPVIERSRDTVDVGTQDGTLALAWSDIRRIEAWGGQNRWKGAALGALAFIGIGIVGEATAPTTSTGERIGAFGGAAVAGAIIGSRYLAREGWQSIPLPAR